MCAQSPPGQAPRASRREHGSLWVASYDTAEVLELDPVSGAVRRTVAFPERSGPEGLALAGVTLWVANSRGASVSSIDTTSGEVTATVKSGVEPRGIAALDGAAWVANTVSDKVALVEP